MVQSSKNKIQPLLTNMTAQPPMTQLPAVSTFESDSAILRPAQLPLWDSEKGRLEILAHEIVRYCPELAGILEDAGINRLHTELNFG